MDSPCEVLDIDAGVAAPDAAEQPRRRGGGVVVVGRGRSAGLLVERVRELHDGPISSIGGPEELSARGERPAGLIYAQELMTYRDALAIDRYAAATGVPSCAGCGKARGSW